MNKKGEKVISIYWFAILFLVAGAVVYMVAISYGKPYDVREVEASILINKIADCLNGGGYLNSEVIVSGKLSEKYKGDNLLTNCNLDFSVEDSFGWQDNQLYIEFSISKFDLNQNNLGGLTFLDESGVGNFELKSFCEIQSGNNFPFCLKRSLYSVNYGGNSAYQIDFLSVVGKVDKND